MARMVVMASLAVTAWVVGAADRHSHRDSGGVFSMFSTARDPYTEPHAAHPQWNRYTADRPHSKPKGGALSKFITHHDKVSLHPLHLTRSRTRARRSPDAEVAVKFTAYGRVFDLRMRRSDGPFAPDFHVEVVHANHTERIAVDRSAYFRGVVAGYGSDHSDVRAHIDGGKLTGSIRVRTRIFRVEPVDAQSHPQLGLAPGAVPDDYNHVIYADNAVVDETHHEYCGLGSEDANDAPDDTRESSHVHHTHTHLRHRRTHTRDRRQTFNIEDHNTCDMRLIADHRYFQSVGGSSVLGTQNRLIDTLEAANLIFKAANFQIGGTVQLAIRKMTIFTTAGASSTGESNPHAVDTTASSTFLDQLSSQNQGQYCLAHSFTHQDFDGGVLGLAFVGTICDGFQSSSTPSVNTGITTTLNQGSTSASLQTNIVFAHEVGHNFGMQHDSQCNDYCSQPGSSCTDCQGNGPICVDGGVSGNFVMFPTAVSGNQPNNRLFSPCSEQFGRDEILAEAAACFRDGTDTSFCGNGVREAGEECDCGVLPEEADNPSFVSLCNTNDPCCSVNCTLKSTSQCSFVSGDCCDQSCQLTGLDPNDVNATTLQPDNATAAASFQCRDETDCTHPAFCIADPQYAGACPSVDFPYDNATVDADDYVFHKPDKTTLCGSNRGTCADGECTGLLCAFFQSASHPNTVLSGCTDSSAPCRVACQFPNIGCVSSSDFATTNVASEGYTIPSSLFNLNRLPGSTCNDFTGYCTDSGQCESVSVDTPLGVLTDINVEIWIWENWWIILLIEIGIIFIAFLLRWTNQKNDTSVWVHAQYRALQGKMSDTAMAAFKTMRSDSKGTTARSQRTRQRRRKERQLKEVAILYGEHRRLQMEVLKEEEREEAYARLKVLFPYTDDHVLRSIIRCSPDEEVAVGRLLTLGHAMWKVDDYKLLHYAVKRYKKEHKAKQKEEGTQSQPKPTHSKPQGRPQNNARRAPPPQRAPDNRPRVARNAAGDSPRIGRGQSAVSFGDDIEDKRFARR
eukprot:m.162062 g.162062  ORF g.162062 m.162062 type:complete len:1018 (+) comp12140_c0_seq1:496-3549(+)